MKYKFENISEEKVAQGKQAINGNGGSISGENTGSFSISGVEGRYLYEEGTLTVVIDDKPWLASWGMIEEKLNDFFN